jgi:type VI protein secretion system component VasK
MTAAWIVSALLYALGCVMAYLALEANDGPHWTAILWPILTAIGVACMAWDATVGGWLWRREHAKWCAVSRSSTTDGGTNP